MCVHDSRPCVWGLKECACMAQWCMCASHHEANSTNSDVGWPVKKMHTILASTRGSEETATWSPFRCSKPPSVVKCLHDISDSPGVRTPKVLRRTDDRLRTASTQVWHHHPLICLITLLSTNYST